MRWVRCYPSAPTPLRVGDLVARVQTGLSLAMAKGRLFDIRFLIFKGGLRINGPDQGLTVDDHRKISPNFRNRHLYLIHRYESREDPLHFALFFGLSLPNILPSPTQQRTRRSTSMITLTNRSMNLIVSKIVQSLKWKEITYSAIPNYHHLATHQSSGY